MTERARVVPRRASALQVSASVVALVVAGCAAPARQPEGPVAAKPLAPAQKLIEDALYRIRKAEAARERGD